MSQQTSLDWYIDEINKSCRESGIHFQLYKEGKEYEYAKEMDKEQMYQVWKTSEQWSDGNFVDTSEAFEQYYNETYGKDI
jgi:hypothetical protein